LSIMTEHKLRRLAPGEGKILNALGLGDLGYSSLKREAGLRSDSKFSEYLKNLVRGRLIQHDILSKRYRLTKLGATVAGKESILNRLASQRAPPIIREVVRPLISTEEWRQVIKAGDAFTTVTGIFEKERRQVSGQEVIEGEGPLPLLLMLRHVNRRAEVALFMDKYPEKAQEAFKRANMGKLVNVFFDALTSTLATMAFGRNPLSDDTFAWAPFFERQSAVTDLLEWLRRGLDLEAWVIMHFNCRETWKQVVQTLTERIACNEVAAELGLGKTDEKRGDEFYEKRRDEIKKRARKIGWKKVLERFRRLDQETKETRRKWLTYVDEPWARKALLRYLSLYDILPLLVEDPRIADQKIVAATKEAAVETLTKLYREHTPEEWNRKLTDEEIVKELMDWQQKGILSIRPTYSIAVEADALRAYEQSIGR